MNLAIPFVNTDISKECEKGDMKYQEHDLKGLAYCVLKEHKCPYQSDEQEDFIKPLSRNTGRHEQHYRCYYGQTLDEKVDNQP